MSTRKVFPAVKKKKDSCGENSKEKNGKSQARRLVCFWEIQSFLIQDTLHAFPIRTISIFIQRSTFICVQGDREREWRSNTFGFYLHGLWSVSSHLYHTLQFFTAPHEETVAIFLHSIFYFIPISVRSIYLNNPYLKKEVLQENLTEQVKAAVILRAGISEIQGLYKRILHPTTFDIHFNIIM